MTNDLVNDNACCLELVKSAIKAIDSKNFENVSFPPPRKVLETPVIVLCTLQEDWCRQLLCFAPHTNTWYKLRDTSPWAALKQMVSCHGTLYTLFKSRTQERDYKLLRYDSFFDRSSDVPYKGKRYLQQIFVSDNNEDGIYALESENETSCPDCVSLLSCSWPERVSVFSPCGKQHLSFITKYKPESNSWEDITSFDFGLRKGICIVAKDNFIYFIGGAIRGTLEVLVDVDRYNLNERKWDKLANLPLARAGASGTAAQEKIFIDGGWPKAYGVKTCEVYNETTNEWQLIAASKRSPYGSIMCVDDKVYVLNIFWSNDFREFRGEIECYDPDKDIWNVITKIPSPDHLRCRH